MDSAIEVWYKREIRLIKANGENEEALRLRFNALKEIEFDLLLHIQQKSLEIIGKKAALDEYVKKKNE